MRDPELIRRDVQIATLTAENLELRAHVGILRADVQAHEMRAIREETLAHRDAFVAELAAARREVAPPPPATPPSGKPLVVDQAVVPAAPAV